MTFHHTLRAPHKFPTSRFLVFVRHQMVSLSSQDRLTRCTMHCNDKAKDMFDSGAKEPAVRLLMDSCVGKCVDDHLNLIPSMTRRLKENLDSIKQWGAWTVLLTELINSGHFAVQHLGTPWVGRESRLKNVWIFPGCHSKRWWTFMAIYIQEHLSLWFDTSWFLRNNKIQSCNLAQIFCRKLSSTQF